MKKLIVKLKQHTPLIHFQNYKGGNMSLRSTDVKPRLDKYIRSIINRDLAEYKLKEEHDAFNYSLRIIPLQLMRSEEILGGGDRKWAPFFANMGDDYKGKEKYIVYPEKLNEDCLRIEIKSVHDELVTLIEMHIVNFFLAYNFMTRSSKGFGSFSVSSVNDIPNNQIPKANYFTIKLINSFQNQSNLFSQIDWFYKALRSGINIKDRAGETVFYFKSCLFKYLNDNGIQWDKKTIKSKFLNRDQRLECGKYEDEIVCEPNPNIQDQNAWKLFLGLSSNESWLSARTTLKSKVLIEKNEFTRSPSFLTLKPIFYKDEYRIYIIEDLSKVDLYPENSSVEFDWNGRTLTLDIGSKEIIKGYLSWIYKNIDGTHGTPQNYNKAAQLKKIFTELQTNYQHAQ